MPSWKVTQQSGLTSAAPRTLSLVAETRSLAILKPNGKRRETHVSDVLRLDTSAGTPCELTVLLRLGGAKTMEKSFGFASASERNSFVAALRSVRDGVADAASDASTAALDAAPGFGDHTPWLPVTPWRAPLPQLLLGEERTRMPRVRASTLIAGSWSSLSTKESAMHWSVHGTALITTFGVRFTVFPAERRRCRFAALSVPALSIARVAVEGEWIVMYCKDMRVVRLCVDAPQRARLKFAAALRNRALPPEGGERELAFAVAHCTARGADRTSGGNGWGVYDPQQELDRMVSGTPAAGAWTLVSNAGFQHVETYASALLVPSTFTSDDLRSAGAARSKGRMAAATWLYPQRGTVLLRASMPSIGLGRATGDKPQLEKYVAAATVGHAGLSGGAKGDRAGTLWIADARPVLNAQVTRLKGGGAEFDIPNLSFHNIENIHVMRASASLLVAACTPSIGSSRTSDGDAAHAVASAQPAIADGGFLAAVDQSKWLQYVATVLAGATSVAELLHGRVDPRTGREVDATSVLVHCSDGWDRTAQLCAIAQLILDPFFRALLRVTYMAGRAICRVCWCTLLVVWRVSKLTHIRFLSFFLSFIPHHPRRNDARVLCFNPKRVVRFRAQIPLANGACRR